MKKQEIIQKIQAIIKKHGNFTTAQIQADCSPIVFSRNNINELCETFNETVVEVVIYHRDEEIDHNWVKYEDLTNEILMQILKLANDYQNICLEED